MRAGIFCAKLIAASEAACMVTACICLVILMFKPTTAVAFDEAPHFSITGDDARFLRYLEYRNGFDYSGSQYYVGEFRLKNANGVKLIPFVDWPAQQVLVQGDSAQGIDYSLLPMGRTDEFEIGPEGDNSIQFFRRMTSWAPSSAFPDLPPGNEDPDYEPTPWDVLDDSEWVIRVMRSSDAEHLFTIDSAGIPAHNDPNLDVRYGDNAKFVKHEVTLPPELNGETVYLQVVPKRSGPTPYGMKVLFVSNWVTSSARYNEYGVERGALNALQSQYLNAVFEYFDEVKTETGLVPEMKFLQLDENGFQQLRERYFVPQTINGKLEWFDVNTKPQVLISTITHPDGTVEKQVTEKGAILVNSVYPLPLNGPSFDVNFTLRRPMELQVTLTSLAGRTLGELWAGQLAQATHTLSLELDLSELADGAYFLMFRSVDGAYAAGQAIQIRR